MTNKNLRLVAAILVIVLISITFAGCAMTSEERFWERRNSLTSTIYNKEIESVKEGCREVLEENGISVETYFIVLGSPDYPATFHVLTTEGDYQTYAVREENSNFFTLIISESLKDAPEENLWVEVPREFIQENSLNYPTFKEKVEIRVSDYLAHAEYYLKAVTNWDDPSDGIIVMK